MPQIPPLAGEPLTSDLTGSIADSAHICAVCGETLHGRPTVRLRASQLHSCDACGSWTYFPRRSPADQTAIHDTKEYFDHPYFALRRHSTQAIIRRCREIFARLKPEIDLTDLRGERILDIGCDTGAFLQAAHHEFGLQPAGIDTASRAVAAARQQNIEAYACTIERAPRELCDFRIVTAIDVLEHVTDPSTFLIEILGRLLPGGVLYLETPNIESCVYRIGSALSPVLVGPCAPVLHRLFPPEHVQYFTKSSLTALARRSGFEIVTMDTRVLPTRDIATSWHVRAAMSVMQTLDQFTRSKILLWAVLRRPLGAIV